jgi:hypothetical protein
MRILEARTDETGTVMKIECSRDGETVQKHFRMSGDKTSNLYTLARKVREADRDITFQIDSSLKGTDFRSACFYKEPWWDLPPGEVFARLEIDP